MLVKAVLPKEAFDEMSQNKLANYLCISVSEVNEAISSIEITEAYD